MKNHFNRRAISTTLLTLFLVFTATILVANCGNETGPRNLLTERTDPNPKIVLVGSMVNSITQKLLPFSFNIPNNRETPDESRQITLVDIIYCGASSQQSSKILALAHPGAAPIQRPQPILAVTDCQSELTTIGERAILSEGTPEWLVVTELNATWQPFELSISFKNVVTVRKPQSTSVPFPNLETLLRNDGSPFKTISTANLKATIENKEEQFNLAAIFRESNVYLLFIPQSEVVNLAPEQISFSDPILDSKELPEFTDFIVKIPNGFSTNFVNVGLADSTIIVSRSENNNPALTLRKLSLVPENNKITVSGLLHNLSPDIEANITSVWESDDLKLTSIQLSAIEEDCNSFQGLERLTCNTRNSTKRTLVSTIGTNLSSKHRGKPLRPTKPENLISFELDRKKYSLSVSVLKTQSVNNAFYLYGNLAVEGQ